MGWIDAGAGGRSLRRLFALGIAAALASTGTSRALPAGFKRGGRVNRRGLIAGAPISWRVIEIPDWGHQMDRDRVLREAAVGLEAMEAGPEVFLPQDPAEVSAALSEHGLGLVGGFVPAVLHEPGIGREGLNFVERQAKFFSAAGADTLILAAATGSESYEEIVELDDCAWKELFENLSSAEEIASRYGITVVVHSHYGTVIESDDQLWRFLEGCDTGLCRHRAPRDRRQRSRRGRRTGRRSREARAPQGCRSGGGRAVRGEGDRLRGGRPERGVPASGRGRRGHRAAGGAARRHGVFEVVRAGTGHRGRERAGGRTRTGE